MRYFYKLCDGVMTMPIMAALARQPELWDQDKSRTTFTGTPHGQIHDVILRFGATDKGAGDDLEAVDREAMRLLPQAKKLSQDIMSMVGGSRLGRVVLTKLEPGKKILPHADTQGAYAKYYTRYHVALQGLPGSLFTCGDETVTMLTGEVWYFDAHAVHSLQNNSKDDRVHLLVDIRVDK